MKINPLVLLYYLVSHYLVMLVRLCSFMQASTMPNKHIFEDIRQAQAECSVEIRGQNIGKRSQNCHDSKMASAERCAHKTVVLFISHGGMF